MKHRLSIWRIRCHPVGRDTSKEAVPGVGPAWMVDLVDLEWDYTELHLGLQRLLEQTAECQGQEHLDFQAQHFLGHLQDHPTHLGAEVLHN